MTKIKRLLKRKEVLVIGFEIVLLLICTLFSLIVKRFYTLPEFVLSATIITLLFFITKWMTEKYVEKSNRKKLYIGTTITSILGLIAYIIIVYNRNFEYVSDHGVYYNLQSELRDVFNLLPLKGLFATMTSCWNSDYSYFISIILALPFTLASGSADSFVITFYITLIIPVCYMNNLLVINLSQRTGTKNTTLFSVLGNIIFLTFPLLHFASILGMPDIFGLFFVFGIVVIMINYDYTKFSFTEAVICSFLMVFLVVTRRWYVFTLIGLFASMMIVVLLDSISNKSLSKNTFYGEVKFATVVAGVFLLTLAPFIYKTLFVRKYAEDYSEYNFGGLPYEIKNQLGFLGISLLLILISGIILGLISKKLRLLTVVSILGYSISIFSYTRIQNMGKHQLLCLVIYYMVFIYNTVFSLDKIKSKSSKYILSAVIVSIFVLNTISTLTGYVNEAYGIHLFTKYALTERFSWNF